MQDSLKLLSSQVPFLMQIDRFKRIKHIKRFPSIQLLPQTLRHTFRFEHQLKQLSNILQSPSTQLPSFALHRLYSPWGHHFFELLKIHSICTSIMLD